MTASETENTNWSTSDRVLNAVIELRAANSTATRETVAALTGLKQTVVDDRLRALADEGKIKRVLRGVYEIVAQYPRPRPISVTTLEDGLLKVEIGETCEMLTPEESRVFGRLFLGYASEAMTSESVRQHMILATDLAAQVKSLSDQVKGLKASKNQRQLDLLEGQDS